MQSNISAMTGKDAAPAWLQTDWLLGQFGEERSVAIARYADFFRAGVGLPSLWKHLQGQVFLGSEAFITMMQNAMQEQARIAEIPRTQRRPIAKPLAHYRDNAADPKAAMAEAYATGDYTMQQIADCFDAQ